MRKAGMDQVSINKTQVAVVLFLQLFILLFSSQSVNAQVSALPAFFKADSLWVDSVYNSLSQRERIGQLMMVAAYSRAFNIQEKRKGGLMEKPFCRKEVDSLKYFKDLVIYIHRNPVHHGITTSPKDYPWSSYHNYFSVNPSPISKTEVLSWFDSTITFKQCHRKPQDLSDIEQYLVEDEE